MFLYSQDIHVAQVGKSTRDTTWHGLAVEDSLTLLKRPQVNHKANDQGPA